MRRSLILLAAAAIFAVPASAKITTVKGAKCVACHEGSPKDKKMNKASADMLKLHKEDKCKDCHGAATADKPMSTTEEALKAAKKK
jgi:hypothetical protein